MTELWREFYERINKEFKRTADIRGLWDKKVTCEIIAKGFVCKPPRGSESSAEHYLKMPSKEYALTKGKEVILRCEFEGSYGDAFTVEPKRFSGKLSDAQDLVFEKTLDRGIYFAILNAMFSSLELIRGAVHCEKEKPEVCGEELAKHVEGVFGKDAVVAHVGYQPGHVEACSKMFKNYVTDLDHDNIGKVKFGTKILSGEKNREVIEKADVACITGSTIVGGSLPELLKWCDLYKTEPIVYGVTASAAAKILNLRHFCPYACKRPN